MEHRHNALGCCGYDELAEKPPTTQPIRFGIRVSNIERRQNEPGVTRRISSMGQVPAPPLAPSVAPAPTEPLPTWAIAAGSLVLAGAIIWGFSETLFGKKSPRKS
jgi:hypothetical protein